jgi:large subunit ribosomal protein L10
MAADAESEATDHRTEQIPEWKREEVADLADLIASYESIGIVSVAGIPSRQLQAMRRDLQGSARLRVARNTLLTRALDEADEGVDDLVDEVEGQVGLIGTNENPFGLYRQLEASKTPAPINAGEVSPNDITIPEGDTGIDPGPFVGELQQVGAEARIMDGSIQVTADSTVLEEGEEVSQALANVLSELGIEPKEVGLDLRTVYADGTLFEADELAIDIDEYRADIESAAAAGRNLSINAAYPTAQTAGALLGKGATEARGLGIEAAVESPDLVEDLVGRADAQLRALAAHIHDDEALPEALQGAQQAADDTTTDEQGDDQPAETETEDEAADTDADDDDDDGDDGGAGLGAMFG